MYRTVMVYPVVEGKDVSAISKLFESRPDEYRESRKAAGVTLERAYQQHTPMGDFVVALLESERPIGEVFALTAKSDLAIDKEFLALVKEIHGIDPTAPPAGKAPETVADWSDPLVTERREGWAFCAPALADRIDAARAWVTDAYVTRLTEFTESRRAIGGTREIVTLHDTPMGYIVGVYVEGSDPVASNRKSAESTTPYDTWFKGQLATFFPPMIDFNKPIEGVSLVFDSQKLLVAR